MFHIGNCIVYGQIGICRITQISVPSFSEDKTRLYYTLEPIQQQGTIFVPTDSPVFMRPVMTREEAQNLIEFIPAIAADTCNHANLQRLTQCYSDKLRSHRCEDLVSLILSIYTKKEERARSNQKTGTADETFLRRAESLFYGELSYALGIAESDLQNNIRSHLQNRITLPSQTATANPTESN